MAKQAVGILETRGLACLVVGVDAMLKAANVELSGPMRQVGSALCSAVVNGDVRPVNDVPITRPGPRLAEGLASLARAVHPELQLDGFPPDPPMCEAS